jgi:hypothetical protein
MQPVRFIAALLIFVVPLCTLAQTPRIVINEIMYAPTGNEPEWVELYNTTSSPINLKNWKITDATGTRATISTRDVFIQPQDYLVIARDSTIFSFHATIPAPVLRINLPALNNTGDVVVLFDSANATVDSLTYAPSWGGASGGFSLERRTFNLPSVLASSWGTSVDAEKSTPGRKNSISARQVDVAVREILFTPQSPKVGDTLSVSAKVQNLGTITATSTTLEFFLDASKDRVAQPSELLERQTIPSLASGDSTVRSVQIPNVTVGEKQFIVRAAIVGDEDTTNNIKIASITVGATVVDVAVTDITFIPVFPNAGDNVTVNAKVTNKGQTTASGYSVAFFNDANVDSIAQPSEQIQFITATPTLAVNGSATLSAQLPNIPAGETRIIVRVNLPGDADTTNNTLIGSVVAGLPPRSLVINEIMYAPSGGEPEWVELFNTTNSTINLRGWKLSDANTTSKPVISTKNVFIVPQSYLVLARDSTIVNFHSSIPAPIVRMSLPSLNNDGDAVVLYDPRNIAMDSLTYFLTWGGSSGGRSLERIDAAASSTDSTNWATSLDVEKSTPGRPNSVRKSDFDLSLVRIFFETIASTSGLPVIRLQAVVRNVGKNTASNFGVSFYADANRDSIPASTELIGNASSSASLNPNDSIRMSFDWQSAPAGISRIIALLEFAQDQRTANNIRYADVAVGSTPGSLVINEIMAAPLTSQAEYVELYNRSSQAVNLLNWKLSDARTSSGSINEFTIRKGEIIQPGEYAVIASDSSLLKLFTYLQTPSAGMHVIILNVSSLSLNNDEDDVAIRDVTGIAIDSVHYSDTWHNPDLTSTTGIALERINPQLSSNDRRNWSSSAERTGGTPGKQNSIFTLAVPTESKISFSPNPFSPDNDGFEDFTIISYQLPLQVAQLRIKIFNSKGRLVRTLVNNEPTGSSGQVIWDGLDDDKQKVRIGIYVVFLEAIDGTGGVLESMKAAVVVAGRL